jgi:hypothetical protein
MIEVVEVEAAGRREEGRERSCRREGTVMETGEGKMRKGGDYEEGGRFREGERG